MLGRETHFHFETQDGPDNTLGSILRGSPRPVVVVPQAPARGSRRDGRRMAAGVKSARTLQIFPACSAWRGEEPIHLVSVNREGWEAESLAHRAADYLRAHGARVQLHASSLGWHPRPHPDRAGATAEAQSGRHGRPGHHPIATCSRPLSRAAILRSCPVPIFIGA